MNIGKNSLFVLVIAVTLIFGIGLFRYNGEYFTRKLYDAKSRDDKSGIIKCGKKAVNFVYTLDPTSVPISWYMGNAYSSVGDFQNAYAELKKAYLLNPFNRNVVNDLGSVFAVTGKADSAKIYYREASRISPRFDDPKLNLVAIYINEKDFRRADSCLKTLLHDSERRTKYQQLVDALRGTP